MSRQDVVRRARRFAARLQDGASREESAIAARLLAELVERHGLTSGELETPAPDWVPLGDETPESPWVAMLMASGLGVGLAWSGGGLAVVGRSRAEAVRFAGKYQRLCEQLRRAYDRALQDPYLGAFGATRIPVRMGFGGEVVTLLDNPEARTSYYAGLVRGAGTFRGPGRECRALQHRLPDPPSGGDGQAIDKQQVVRDRAAYTRGRRDSALVLDLNW